jgi:hypothetical protein
MIVSNSEHIRSAIAGPTTGSVGSCGRRRGIVERSDAQGHREGSGTFAAAKDVTRKGLTTMIAPHSRIQDSLAKPGPSNPSRTPMRSFRRFRGVSRRRNGFFGSFKRKTLYRFRVSTVSYAPEGV